MTIPSLLALRELDHTVTFFGHQAAGEILKDAGLVQCYNRQGSRETEDNIYTGVMEIVGRMNVRYNTREKGNMRQFLGNPELMVAFTTDVMGMSYALEEFGIHKSIVQNWQPPVATHQSEFDFVALRNAGFPCRFDSAVEVQFQQPLPNLPPLNLLTCVVLQPGSAQHWKRWPLDKWVELSQKLRHIGKTVIVLQGPDERRENWKQKFHGCFVLQLGLKEIAGLLGHKPAFIGNDSGITHLAGLSGCPVIGIYGPTSPSQFGPLGPNVTVLRECSKDEHGDVRVCYDEDCMDRIPVNHVLSVFINKVGVR